MKGQFLSFILKLEAKEHNECFYLFEISAGFHIIKWAMAEHNARRYLLVFRFANEEENKLFVIFRFRVIVGIGGT